MTKLDRFENEVLSHCRRKGIFNKNDRLLLAVSGGLDSMVMATVFERISKALEVDIGIAHINHGLRKASDRDESLVRSFARSHHRPFAFLRADVAKIAAMNHSSIEDTGRRVRYEFLQEAADAGGFSRICTAHHRDDQAETILMRLIKGTGLRGLQGIRPNRQNIVRPLLEFERAELEAYAKRRKIRFREDASNRSNSYMRNRVRNRIMPLLQKEIDPQAARHLAQVADLIGELMPAISAETDRAFETTCTVLDGKILLDIYGFNEYLRIYKFLIIDRILATLQPRTDKILLDSSSFDSITRLINSQTGKQALVGNVTCQRDRDTLVFFANQQKVTLDFGVVADRAYDKGGVRFSSKVLASKSGVAKKFGKSRNVEFIDFDCVQGSLKLRPWKNADTFVPIGLNRTKKVSDFFIDQKVPLHMKKHIPLLVDCHKNTEKVIWICGFRLDDRYKISSTTTRILRMQCDYEFKKN